MNLRLAVAIVGFLVGLAGSFQLVPAGLALIWGEPAWPFLAAAAAGGLVALGGWLGGRGARRELRPRDGYLVVTLGWLAVSAIGAVPYLAGGGLAPVDAWFESVSGFTTTGSTVLTDIESHTRSLLLWRAMTQWLGGMGIIVFTIAVLPLLGVGGMQLFKAEVPGPVADKVAPRVAVTARYLWYVYVGLTALQALLLVAGGLTVYDAVCHAFTTLATGGFSPRAESIAAFASPFVRWVIIVFMALAGMNFVLHFKLVRGRVREALSDEELHWYAALLVGLTAVVAAGLIVSGTGAGQAIEDAAFTVVSLVTTTGYATADYELWPVGLHGVVLVALVLGGMAGSTGGGVKTLRTLVASKTLRASFRRIVRPHVVHPVTYRRRIVSSEVIDAIWGFFFAYILLAAAGMLVINVSGVDLVTAWSASLTAIGNVGPGLGEVGPSDTFAHFAGVAKVALSFLMICGRLEIYTVLVILTPGFWRH